MTGPRQRVGAALLAALALGTGCGEGSARDGSDEARALLRLPHDDFPLPPIPEDNPLTAAKAELGRHLFYDRRLSENQTQSCASCHFQELAFTDARAQSVGSTGDITPRSAMGLGNVAYQATFTWANPVLRSLEAQALLPMFGEDPVELGLAGKEQVLFQRLRDDPEYPARFAEAFPERPDPISLESVVDALGSFQRTMVSFDSPYDRYIYGEDATALSPSAQRGMALFFSEQLECFHCHGGFNFSAGTMTERSAFVELAFFNNGLYDVGGTGDYPWDNQGVYEITDIDTDRGRFKAPSLRNVAVTAPYMHDGSLETLEAVIAHYARGGTLTEAGPNAGDGKGNPNKSALVAGFSISSGETADLVAFLESLTDPTFLEDPALANPRPDDPNFGR